MVESHLGYLAQRICQEGFSVGCDADNILLLSSVPNVRISFPDAVEIAMPLCALEQTELEYILKHSRADPCRLGHDRAEHGRLML